MGKSSDDLEVIRRAEEIYEMIKLLEDVPVHIFGPIIDVHSRHGRTKRPLSRETIMSMDTKARAACLIVAREERDMEALYMGDMLVERLRQAAESVADVTERKFRRGKGPEKRNGGSSSDRGWERNH